MANILASLHGRLGRKKRNEALPLLVFKEFEGSVNLIEDADHIARNFLGKIREVVPHPRLILLIHDPDLARFMVAASANITEADARSISFPRASRLVRWLKVNETYLEFSRRSGVLEYLTGRETELLDGLGIEICFPLISMNRLIGILLVGGKPDGESFTAAEAPGLPGGLKAAGLPRGLKPRASGEPKAHPLTKLEISFISSLLPQAGIALENALLFREQRQRLRRMSRADKLATVGELAAGAAHEIRNPLTAIRSSLQYLETKSPDEVSRKLLSTALQETERIDGIISALLAFSRPSEIAKERHDLRETIEESLELVSIQAKTRKVALSKTVPPAPILIRADRAQLKQLFLNIFLNAIQAMPAGGTMSVEARIKDERKAFVTVTDTGEGIPEENLDRIFDPFFTTKKGGTGLGLSICYNIVKSHQGEIEVKSRPGEGTTILITLPLY